MQIIVEVSTTVHTGINKYAKYTATSRSSSVAFFLSMIEKQYIYNKNSFLKLWNEMKYRPICPDGKGYSIDHRKRFSVTISKTLNISLRKIAFELSVNFIELTARFIKLALNQVFTDYEIDLAQKIDDIEKQSIIFNTSNVMINRISTIAEIIGTPRNALISHAVTEYLIRHYEEFDEHIVYSDGKNNYTGLW